MTDVFHPAADGGTDIEIRVGAPRPKDRKVFEAVMAEFTPMVVSAAEALGELLAHEQQPSGGGEEPPAPATRHRHLTEPITGAAGSVDSGDRRSSEG